MSCKPYLTTRRPRSMAACAAALDQLQADAFLPALEQFNFIISHLRSTGPMTHSELEQFLDLDGREMLRRIYQGYLDERGPGAVTEPVVDANGQEHTHQRLHSHSLQRQIAEASAKESYDEVVGAICDQTGVTVPKRQVEEAARRASRDFELFYKQQRSQNAREVKKTGPILTITVDGKGVPMRKADLREATRRAADERQPRLKHRRSPGEKSKTKRMSTVAAVYAIEPFVRTPEQIMRELAPIHDALPPRPRPEDKRVWASVKHPPEAIIKQAFEEAQRRDPKHTKEWVALVDGNETQLDLLRLAAKDYGVELAIILDLIHVLEYLWKAAWAFHAPGDRAAETWVGERLAEILRGHSSLVAAGMRRSATLRGLSEIERVPIDDCADYLLKYREFLRYDQYLAKGYPIATGVIEGACRYLVKDRMEITGARWSLEGAESVLRLRSLRASGDFDEYWEFHLQQEYKRNHEARYENGHAPLPNPAPGSKPKAPHLRVVK